MTSASSRLCRHCLILVAHGSRRHESNEEIEVLVRELGTELQQDFDAVTHAFLEITRPSISDAFDTAVQSGYDTITVLPYFLAAGTHVHKDIPSIVQQKQADYPDIDIQLTPYLGSDERIITILAALAREAMS